MRPEQAELVLAELTVLAPNGVEEERGPGYVEYAIYGGEGELPELGELEAAAGDGLVEVVATEVPDDWADRWQDFHKPLLVGERLWLRPSWEEPRDGAIDLVVDPGRAFGTGAHPTTRLCLELPAGAGGGGRGRRPPHRPRHRLRRPRDRRRQARLEPGAPATTTSRPAIEAASRQRSGERRRDRPSSQRNLRESLPSSGPGNGGRQHDRSGPARRLQRAAEPVTRGPSTLILSGLLPPRARRHRGSLRPRWALAEADRRLDGDWAALLLRG